ncbi:MAG TPA: hypothetical protein VMP01_28200 [Pirellulaceae bacterium]|nr:hypothetical protein [Pirellulaceae bacterium]
MSHPRHPPILPIRRPSPRWSRAGSPGKVAGFDPPEPIGAMAGFAPDNRSRRYFRTVSRSTPSSRAIRRCEYRSACNDKMDSISAILRTFAITGILPRQCR